MKMYRTIVLVYVKDNISSNINIISIGKIKAIEISINQSKNNKVIDNLLITAMYRPKK